MLKQVVQRPQRLASDAVELLTGENWIVDAELAGQRPLQFKAADTSTGGIGLGTLEIGPLPWCRSCPAVLRRLMASAAIRRMGTRLQPSQEATRVVTEHLPDQLLAAVATALPGDVDGAVIVGAGQSCAEGATSSLSWPKWTPG